MFGWESQSPPEAESGNGQERQQEGLLQVYRQQMENKGKCGPTAEWEWRPGDTGHGEG